ncbi:hypothetical protein ABKN59_001343 [Abortiporus biennis]
MELRNTLPNTQNCKSVTTLIFPAGSENRYSDQDLASILPFCSRLHTVELSGFTDFSDRTLELLASTTSTRLWHIDLSGCQYISSNSIQRLASLATSLRVVKLNNITSLGDPALCALIRHLAHLTELEVCNWPMLTPVPVRDIWILSRRQLRVLKLAHCSQITDKAFPYPSPPPDAPVLSSLNMRLRNASSQYVAQEHIIPRTLKHNASLPKARSRPLDPLDALPPLLYPSTQMMQNLQVVDISHCYRITDEAIAGLIWRSHHIKSLNIAGCVNLTDVSLSKIAGLGGALHHIVLSGLTRITDRGMVTLFRSCRDIKTISISGCKSLTDLTVMEMAGLKSLQRLDMTNLTRITDISILYLAEHDTSTLKWLDMSGCGSITITSFHVFINNSLKLEYIGASGIPSMRRKGVKRFSESRPSSQDDTYKCYRVFQGNRIDDLRRFLDKEDVRRREAEKNNIKFVPREDDSMALY